MTEDEIIRMESRFKKEEIPEELIGIIKLKIGYKKTFVLGMIKYLESRLDGNVDDCKKKELKNFIHSLNVKFGFL